MLFPREETECKTRGQSEVPTARGRETRKLPTRAAGVGGPGGAGTAGSAEAKTLHTSSSESRQEAGDDAPVTLSPLAALPSDCLSQEPSDGSPGEECDGE